MKKLFYILSGLLLLAIAILAGCNQGGEQKEEQAEAAGTSNSNKTESEGKINVTDASGQEIVFDKAPETFAALSSGDLDILLALGADVVGRPTSQGTASAELEGIEQIGNPHQPNFEKIAEVNPDVLVGSLSMKAHEENLERQGTKLVYSAANSVEDIQNTISLTGEMLGKEAEAKTLNSKIDSEIKAASDAKTTGEGPRALLVYGSPGTYLAALPSSLSGNLLELAGGENIASDFPKEDNYPQYASLSVEKIIERNPEVVMLITHGDPEAVRTAFEEEMKKSPAWKNLDAVKEDRVIVLPSHLFGTNPGTKIVEAFKVMQESLEMGVSK